ncbi:nucleoside diphosphate kinase regulator [Methylobacterium radiodurans]|uniref:Nucleoside diphosphate kinase regulator n=2 Tax=Methylobacterium radiodurans TaxID=2202828 RepID=A0A2U8W039_9HYPH|nr:nucleoside diphosphate kinase regulator [Methylobacterium radiodurans]
MSNAASEHLPPLIIPMPDFRTLRLVASGVRDTCAQATTATWLAAELDRAAVVTSDVVPADVVTMHARVEYRDDVTEQIGRMTLVYPGEDHWDERCVSVLSPLGAAVLGLSEGQSIRWRTPSGGMRGVTVLRVLFQPYRATAELIRRDY